MAVLEQWYNQDLKAPVYARHSGLAFTADQDSLVVGVHVFSDGEPATVSGSVSCTVIRSDGATVAVPAAAGTVSGSDVSVTLPAAAFAVQGAIAVMVQLVTEDAHTTLLKVVFDVEPSNTDTIVDPSGEIALDVGDLIEQMQDAETALDDAIAQIPTDYSGLLALIAPNYSDIAFPVSIGSFCVYNSVLYQAAQSIGTRETFNPAHWIACSIGSELKEAYDTSGAVEALQNAANKASVLHYPLQYVGYARATAYSTYQPGDFVPSSGRRTGFIPVKNAQYCEVTTYGNAGTAAIAFYNASKTFISAVACTGPSSELMSFRGNVPSTAAYVVFSAYNSSADTEATYQAFSCTVASGLGVKSWPERINAENVGALPFTDIIYAPSNTYFTFYTNPTSANAVTQSMMANLPSYSYSYCSVLRLSPEANGVATSNSYAMMIALCANGSDGAVAMYTAYGLGDSTLSEWQRVEFVKEEWGHAVQSYPDRINATNVGDLGFSDIIAAKSNTYYAFFTAPGNANAVTSTMMANLPTYNYSYCTVLRLSPQMSGSETSNSYGLMLALCANNDGETALYVTFGLNNSTISGWRKIEYIARRDLKISIIGDSISSYLGYCPSGYAVYYPKGDVTDVSYTWWYSAFRRIGATLLSNASYASSTVAGDDTSGAIVASSDARVAALASGGVSPDVVIVYIGTNDFGRSYSIGQWSEKTAVPTSANVENFKPAYAKMINKVQVAYPNARILCCTLPARTFAGDATIPVVNQNANSRQEFNDAIVDVARCMDCEVVDLASCGITQNNLSGYIIDESGTFIHPNKAGHALISDKIYQALLRL